MGRQRRRGARTGRRGGATSSQRATVSGVRGRWRRVRPEKRAPARDRHGSSRNSVREQGRRVPAREWRGGVRGRARAGRKVCRWPVLQLVGLLRHLGPPVITTVAADKGDGGGTRRRRGGARRARTAPGRPWGRAADRGGGNQAGRRGRRWGANRGSGRGRIKGRRQHPAFRRAPKRGNAPARQWLGVQKVPHLSRKVSELPRRGAAVPRVTKGGTNRGGRAKRAGA